MRVATYYSNSDIRIEESQIPKIGPGELLLKLRSASICGSDVMEWYRVGKGPRILGHEISGEIIEVGSQISKYKKGDRVAASHHVPCYNCHYCKLGHHTLCDTIKKTNFDPGGFAEYIRLPAINVEYGVYPLGDSISYEEGTFVEPLACVVRAQRKAGVRKGQTVLVIGSGISGLLHIQYAKALGIQKIIAADINDYRMKAAAIFGADFVYESNSDLVEKIRHVNEGRLADVVIVCAGAEPAIELSLKAVEKGGTILFFALSSPKQIMPLAMNDIFWQRGATLMSSYAASPEDHRESLDLIKNKKINVSKMISHRLPFHEIGKGFDLVAKGQESLKIIIDPSM